MEIPLTLKEKHFLVVDDYPSMRELISQQLKKLGITKITFAESGNEAMRKIVELESSDPIQYVLSDLIMNDGNGIDLIKNLREKLGKKGIPIIMITSKAEIVYVLEAARSGVSSYLVKPWEEEEFAKKLIEADKN